MKNSDINWQTTVFVFFVAFVLLIGAKSSVIAQDKQVKPSVSTATDKTVFGIRLGEKFSIPECEKSKVGLQLRYKFSSDKLCFERNFNRVQESGGIINDSVIVKFPISDAPQIMSSYEMFALVLDGNLEGIGFNTAGIRNAEMVLEKLKEKYGSPSTLVPKKVQNRLGASFDAFDAVWNLQDLVVLFQSVRSSLDSGLINIDTKKGREWRDKQLKESSKDKRPL